MKSKAIVFVCVSVGMAILVPAFYAQELPNRIPQPAPYNTQEAQFFPPPFESLWNTTDSPGNCDTCHSVGEFFPNWNGSMMSNSWRDPGWRAAFYLLSKLTSTNGNCAVPNPPDGTAKAVHNPFDSGNCTSTWNLGSGTNYPASFTTSSSGSLLDGFCSRCHMPANYIDNIPLPNVTTDSPSGMENGMLDPNFNPTSDNGTGLAFATLSTQFRNTDAGKRGVFCEMCHTLVETRYTPFHNYDKNGTEYVPALGTTGRNTLVPVAQQDMLSVPDSAKHNLGYGIGAGAYRISPHALNNPERFGPLTWNDFTTTLDPYVSDVFNITFDYQQGQFAGKHDGFYSVLLERGEFCASCHDVTNSLPIKNSLGYWVGGFPIERTYTEWSNSRYANRPGNTNYQPAYERDCQTCHMQQDFGQPGTAQTLYDQNGNPAPPLSGDNCGKGPTRPVKFKHHFIGGNAYITRLIGAALDASGTPQPYPELSAFSFSSASTTSVYHNAVWTNVTAKGPRTQHERLAWDRLRNVLDLNLSGPATANAGTTQALTLSVTNSGSGHNFPTGFPEGRVAWVSVRAWDLATGNQLLIQDSAWSNRQSLGVGYLTTSSMVDPNYPGCNWTIPEGSPDPFAYQFKAVASLGNGCPTLDLPYAKPLNLVVNVNGLPIDASGTVINRDNPFGLPQYTDVNGNGDLFDDSFLKDTRLRPMPHAGATANLNRYSVVIPSGTIGPVAVTAAVYYQSFEAITSKEFLGNLADTNANFLLEPCVLGGLCDGRTPTVEPAVVEGAPPVPMEVKNWVINITGQTDTKAPTVASTYPANNAVDVYDDVVVKVRFSEPVTNVNTTNFTLVDSTGVSVPAYVSQIGDGVWALFPTAIYLNTRAVYTANVAGICDYNNNCMTAPATWSFTVTSTVDGGSGDTSVPLGFPVVNTAPRVTQISPANGATGVLRNTNIVATFSKPVTSVTSTTFLLNQAGGSTCSTLGTAIGGTITSNGTRDIWTFTPGVTLSAKTLYCVRVTSSVTDDGGQALNPPFASSFTTGKN